MRKSAGLIVLVGSVLAMTSGAAEAGGRRGGPVMTPFGELYNTNSPEWRASGGNPLVYQQLVEQKMLMRQQQQELKQQQLMQKQMQKGAKGKSVTSSGGLPASTSPVKKKRRTYVPTGNTAKSEVEGGQNAPSPVIKGDTIPDPLKSPSTTPAPKKPTVTAPKDSSAP